MRFTFLQNLISLASAGLGALLAVSIGVSHRRLCALISFAAGTLFATALFAILPETFEFVSKFAAFLALGSGYLLFYLVSRFVFHVCPACAASHFDKHTGFVFKNIAPLLIIAFGVHCTMDGIAMALGGELAGKIDRTLFLTIVIHKFPEGLALSAFLIKEGFERMKSLLFTLTLELLTVLGWVLGIFLLKGFSMGDWFYLALAHIGGGFVYLALHAVLNESRVHSPRYVVFFFLAGIAAVALADLIPAH